MGAGRWRGLLRVRAIAPHQTQSEFRGRLEARQRSFCYGSSRLKWSIISSGHTQTGHLNNHWSIGPSILWAPFLIATHIAVLVCNLLGAHIRADGFSLPYLVTMALATTLYGFLGLCLSYRLAIDYFDRRWALMSTLGIWWASSLPVYMYFNPSWSHAHSAFAVALFFGLGNERAVKGGQVRQWIGFGLISGLMVNVYYANGAMLLAPLLEAVGAYWKTWGLKYSQFCGSGSPSCPARRLRVRVYRRPLATYYF